MPHCRHATRCTRSIQNSIPKDFLAFLAVNHIKCVRLTHSKLIIIYRENNKNEFFLAKLPTMNWMRWRGKEWEKRKNKAMASRSRPLDLNIDIFCAFSELVSTSRVRTQHVQQQHSSVIAQSELKLSECYRKVAKTREKCGETAETLCVCEMKCFQFRWAIKPEMHQLHKITAIRWFEKPMKCRGYWTRFRLSLLFFYWLHYRILISAIRGSFQMRLARNAMQIDLFADRKYKLWQKHPKTILCERKKIVIELKIHI